MNAADNAITLRQHEAYNAATGFLESGDVEMLEGTPKPTNQEISDIMQAIDDHFKGASSEKICTEDIRPIIKEHLEGLGALGFDPNKELSEYYTPDGKANVEAIGATSHLQCALESRDANSDLEASTPLAIQAHSATKART